MAELLPIGSEYDLPAWGVRVRVTGYDTDRYGRTTERVEKIGTIAPTPKRRTQQPQASAGSITATKPRGDTRQALESRPGEAAQAWNRRIERASAPAAQDRHSDNPERQGAHPLAREARQRTRLDAAGPVRGRRRVRGPVQHGVPQRRAEGATVLPHHPEVT